LGWGDWNVILAVSRANEDRVLELANAAGASAHRIGRFTAEHGEVMLQRGKNVALAPLVSSAHCSSWSIGHFK